MEIKEIIEQGLVTNLQDLLVNNPEYSNQVIKWGDRQQIETEPLHYISDCVFNGLLTNGNEAKLAKILIEHGAQIDGSNGAESPLIAAVSLSVESVAKVLIDAGSDISSIAVHGANSLHWACYVGLPDIVSILLNLGSDIEERCVDFKATPLFWAVQGFCNSNEADKSHIVSTAKLLVRSGANTAAENFQGCSVLERAHQSKDEKLIQIIASDTEYSIQ